ncbi:hypothetical protein C8F04DRAFT_1111136 [Mycena alexandri]|uniref:Uncharacterized protein n=1 Tax=Mycena alexandri TaxID=1745969 RepID=A0AAD6SNW9_9AGAR|nr:hypothetical protein C8F04DRAFT_1111136 [Mycena alexandri]
MRKRTVPVRLAVIVVWVGRPTCIDRRSGLGYDDRSPSTRASVTALVRLVVTDVHHLSTTARLLRFATGTTAAPKGPAFFFPFFLFSFFLLTCTLRWTCCTEQAGALLCRVLGMGTSLLVGATFWATASICTDTMWGGIQWSGFAKFPGLLAVPDDAWISPFVKCKAKTAADTLSILCRVGPLFVSTRRISLTCSYAFFADFSSHLQMVAFRTCFLRRPYTGGFGHRRRWINSSRLKNFGSVENAASIRVVPGRLVGVD